jgi:hypothetical protein
MLREFDCSRCGSEVKEISEFCRSAIVDGIEMLTTYASMKRQQSVESDLLI